MVFICFTYDVLISVKILEPPAKDAWLIWTVIGGRSECVFSDFHHSEGDNSSDCDVDSNKEERPELFPALVHLIVRL